MSKSRLSAWRVPFLLMLCSVAHGEITDGGVAADGTREAPALVRNDDLAFVRRRGVELYELHQATLIALDAAREIVLGDVAPEGWVVLRDGDALRVRFVGRCDDGPCGLADVLIDLEQLTAQALYPPVPLEPLELDAWRARQIAFRTQSATCDVPYNAVTIPPSGADEAWVVYLVPQPTDADTIAVAGHLRITVDVSSRRVLSAEEFSASCILVPLAAGETQLAIDYGWASLPAEIHVLNSLLHRRQLFVGTRGGIFRVNGDEVELIADVDPAR